MYDFGRTLDSPTSPPSYLMSIHSCIHLQPLAGFRVLRRTMPKSGGLPYAAVACMLLLLVAVPVPSTDAARLVTYWGQNGNEGTLASACQTGTYDVVILSFLYIFGEGQTPSLNLAGHCDPGSGTCTSLSSDIDACHASGVTLLLSLGGGADTSTYDLTSDAEAADLADYVWNYYLGGTATDRPLGASVLDGVDLDIEKGSGIAYYGAFLSALRGYSSSVVLSATPQCPFPDAHLGPGTAGSAIDSGLLNWVAVQFYNNPPCQYSSSTGSASLLSSWQLWSSSVSSSQLLLGLPASSDAASAGFIPADVLQSDVLPTIKSSANYGGVMLYSYYYDLSTGYGASIRSSVVG